ncbi:hypothetical protein OPV22_005353 [Ensete ventricosum]|uniref:Uncharacterized protein n=1 Tax=Ensete ventricosum TaxID=4639 RepID=A0AAV8RIX3_ENSVE|nr:hypothetical protein OPV22_005353 [Ensete ventricosum]
MAVGGVLINLCSLPEYLLDILWDPHVTQLVIPIGSASFYSASSSDCSSDGDLGSCSGHEEAFDAPKALDEMNKEQSRDKVVLGTNHN